MTAQIIPIEEIERIPTNAQIAFAARCARRVEHLLDRRWPAVPRYQRREIQKMIEVAEAGTADSGPALAHDPSGFLAFSRREHSLPKAAAFAAVFSAFKAAQTRSPAYALRAADFAALALTADHTAEAGEDLRGLRRDFEAFANLLQTDEWLAEGEIGPEVFGPLGEEEFSRTPDAA